MAEEADKRPLWEALTEREQELIVTGLRKLTYGANPDVGAEALLLRRGLSSGYRRLGITCDPV